MTEEKAMLVRAILQPKTKEDKARLLWSYHVRIGGETEWKYAFTAGGHRYFVSTDTKNWSSQPVRQTCLDIQEILI